MRTKPVLPRSRPVYEVRVESDTAHLQGDVQARNIEQFEHNLGCVFTILWRVQWRFSLCKLSREEFIVTARVCCYQQEMVVL